MMTKRNARSALVLGLLLLSPLAGIAIGCAGMGGTPEPCWVSGQCEDNSKQNFVSAVGAGADLESARTAAKAELSRVFSARVQSEFDMLTESRTGADGRGREQSSIVESLIDKTVVMTDSDFNGVEVPQTWRDPKTGQIWALAVLSRRTECARLRGVTGETATAFDGYVDRAEGAGSGLEAVRAYLQAVKLGSELDQQRARARVVGGNCAASARMTTAEAKTRAEDRLARLHFVIEANDIDPKTGRVLGPLPQLRQRIADELTDMGLKVGPGGDPVRVKAELRLSEVTRNPQWVEFRWEGGVEIASEIPGEPAVVALSEEGSESHPERSTARLRARRNAEETLSRQITNRLKDYLYEAPVL